MTLAILEGRVWVHSSLFFSEVQKYNPPEYEKHLSILQRAVQKGGVLSLPRQQVWASLVYTVTNGPTCFKEKTLYVYAYRPFTRLDHRTHQGGETHRQLLCVRVCVSVCVCVLSHVRLFAVPWTVPTRLLRPWASPGKSTGVGCHLLLQGTFLTHGSNLRLFHLLHWQADSSPPHPLGNPPRQLLIAVKLQFAEAC